MSARRVVVIGAGPVGLVAALGALERGHAVTVLEAGGAVGDALRRWGPTRLFTPLAMNLPAEVRARLDGAPPPEALLTGPEMADVVLAPLARVVEGGGGAVRLRHRVVAVGRARLSRGELAGHPVRAERPFRLLVETPEGERVVEAERVLDASGVYATPAAMGAGGLPAVGERAAAPELLRDLGALDRRLPTLAGRRVLVVGHGHSAAHALLRLDELARAEPSTRVTWAVRSAQLRPCVEVAPDPLPERRAVVARANQLALAPPPWLSVERRVSVEEIARLPEGGFAVRLGADRRVLADDVVALTGYRPDLGMLSELTLEIAPATEGTARLARAVARVTDCLSVPAVAPGDLESGEPGFHLVGAKSYGRSRTFLLATGYAHLAAILDRL